MSLSEEFVIRTTGGPWPGDHVILGPWPLPAEIADLGGRYVKVSESQLPSGIPHIMRGAQYEWEAIE